MRRALFDGGQCLQHAAQGRALARHSRAKAQHSINAVALHAILRRSRAPQSGVPDCVVAADAGKRRAAAACQLVQRGGRVQAAGPGALLRRERREGEQRLPRAVGHAAAIENFGALQSGGEAEAGFPRLQLRERIAFFREKLHGGGIAGRVQCATEQRGVALVRREGAHAGRGVSGPVSRIRRDCADIERLRIRKAHGFAAAAGERGGVVLPCAERFGFAFNAAGGKNAAVRGQLRLSAAQEAQARARTAKRLRRAQNGRRSRAEQNRLRAAGEQRAVRSRAESLAVRACVVTEREGFRVQRVPPRRGENACVFRAGAAGLSGANFRARRAAPDEVAAHAHAGVDSLAGPDLCAGCQHGARAEHRPVAQRAVLIKFCACARLRAAAQHRAGDARPFACASILPQHGTGNTGVRADPRARADYRALAEQRVFADYRARADVHVSFQPRGRGDLRRFGDARACVEPHAAVEKIGLRADVGAFIADIAPVCVRDEAVNRLALPHQPRKKLLPEIARSVRNAVERFGRKDVNTGVDRIGVHFAPAGLFDKARHAAVFVRDDHAVGERFAHPGEHERGQRALLRVKTKRGGQVAVGQTVAGENDERFFGAQAPLGDELDAARRADGILLARVMQAHAVLFARAERAGDALGQIQKRYAYLRQFVTAQQLQRIGKHGLSENGYHGLGRVACQRAQARSLAARHDDRLKGHSDSSQ